MSYLRHSQGAWIDGIKGKFKRGRRILTNHLDTTHENGGDNSDDEIIEERSSQKRARQEFELNTTSELSHEKVTKYTVCCSTFSRVMEFPHLWL